MPRIKALRVLHRSFSGVSRGPAVWLGASARQSKGSPRSTPSSARLFSGAAGPDDAALFLHISPSGDWWVAPGIYAAKHNPSGYVKSIPIPPGFQCALDDDFHDLHNVYDSGKLPADSLRPLDDAV
ncbi:hypothetical protein M885DRAFT_531275 [Pelagophyceae sp. CCMP2097]|nr:hypothetical protein M885DRAFT_531275 [Pelagophyceae sp. CCMP2097]|mmetsp:Transcript_16770/g.56660  ORF Transcript_16770/g.56660 Transcript_16770/m.56660 type:complete len:126 (+) Transcript_16770:79-456(+)